MGTKSMNTGLFLEIPKGECMSTSFVKLSFHSKLTQIAKNGCISPRIAYFNVFLHYATFAAHFFLSDCYWYKFTRSASKYSICWFSSPHPLILPLITRHLVLPKFSVTSSLSVKCSKSERITLFKHLRNHISKL